MRKDAKIGFAVGGVLLAVLTVYAIVVPRHKKTNNAVSYVTPPPQAVETSQSPVMIAGGDSNPTPVPAPTPSPANNLANNAPPLGGSHGDLPPALNPDPLHTPQAPSGPGKPDDQKPGDLVIDHGGLELPDVPSEMNRPNKIKKLKMEVPEAPLPANSTDRVYIVKAGQTLTSIANDIYGNPRFWVAIQRENKSVNANRLKIGQKISLPDISPVLPGTGVEQPMANLVESATPANFVSPPTNLNPHSDLHTGEMHTDARSYVVKPGDSLYKIARTVLGSGRKADALYALNRDTIGPDKTKLKLDMVLKLPERSALPDAAVIR